MPIYYMELRGMNTQQTINPTIEIFSELYREELTDCNPNAVDLLDEYIRTRDNQVLDDFVYYHLDELDACFPEAADLLMQIAKKHDIAF